MPRIHAYHLPADVICDEMHTIAAHDDVEVIAPALSAAQLEQVCTQLVAARAQLLQLSTQHIIAAIDRAARALRDHAGTAFHDAVAALVAITGYSRPMAELTLDRMSEDWLAPALHQLVDAEFGTASVLEEFVSPVEGMSTRVVSSPLALHVFSGNVPGVGITSLIRSLLVRSAVLGKCADAEPALTPMFARLLAQADPVVGACIAVTYWRGGDVEREAVMLRHAGMVVHYGSADAIASLRARAAHTPFVEHGPRISFAVINTKAGSASDNDTARDLAYAVALFDQQGCVSPQLAYVIGTAETARRFAEDVNHALHELAPELPRGRIAPAEASAIRDLRTRAEFRAIAGDDTAVLSGAGLAHTVVFTADPAFEGTCLNRTLLVKPAASFEHVLAHAGPFAEFLQTVGIAGFDDHERERVALQLAGIGVSRVTPIRAMPWPLAVWHHDGRGPLRELVRWLDLES